MFDVARTVASTDGVQVVVYDAPGEGTPVLFSHATGFHGRVFAPVAARLAAHPRTTFDYRGYGDTAAPRDRTLHWEAFGDDALAVARDVRARHDGRPIVAAGHSMGGAGLVMAALREPSLFAAIVAFEPIIFPPSGFRPDDMPPNPLVAATRKRRATFPSLADARANFASKPPMSAFRPDALDAYVDHGFRATPDGVTLKCNPEHEARTYETGGGHATWNALTTLAVPLWVVGSPEQTYQPSAIAPRIAEQVPGARFEAWSEVSHFGPMEDPDRFADFVATCARTATGS